jgi:hypothetical protein
MCQNSLLHAHARQKHGNCDRYFLEERVVVRHSLKSLSRFADKDNKQLLQLIVVLI